MRMPIAAGTMLVLASIAGHAGGTECLPATCADYGLDRSLVAWQEIDPQGRLDHVFTDTELELAGDTGWMLTNFGSRIAAYDFSDPTAIRLLGLRNQIFAGEHLVLDGERAFVTGSDGLAVYDLSDGAHARLLSSYFYQGLLTRACRVGNFAFVQGIRANVVQEFMVFDVTDPVQPVLLRRATPLGASIHEFGGGLVAVGTWGLRTYSVTTGGDLVLTANVALTPGVRDVLVAGDIAYVKTGTAATANAVEVFDLAISPPARLATVTLRDINRHVVGGDRLYVADDLLGVMTYDVGDPGSPRLVSRVPWAIGIRDMAPCRGYLVTTTDTSVMQTLDTEAAGVLSPPPLAPLPPTVIDGTGDGDGHIFATTWVPGDLAWDLDCFDVSDPAAPREVGHYSGSSRLDNPRLRGPYIVYDRLVVADVSDPTHPRVVSPQQAGTHVALGDSLAYLAGPEGSGAITIHDFRYPSHPQIIGTATVGFDAGALAVAGGTVLAADGSLVVSLDLAAPGAPVRLGEVPVPLGACLALEVRDGLAFYLSTQGDLGIIDVSEPSQPRLAGRIPVGDVASGALTALTLAGDRLLAIRAGAGFMFAERQCGDIVARTVVDVVVEPRDRRHRVPCGGRAGGTITAAVLTTATFDARQVDPATVRFGPGEAAPLAGPDRRGHHPGRDRRDGRGPRLVDVDCDGDRDLVLEFRGRDAAIACGDTVARLDGLTLDGTAICGQGRVSTRPSHGLRDGAQDESPVGEVAARDCRSGPDPEGAEVADVPAPALAPNPFNPVTHVEFALEAAADVSVRVYDLAGRLVAIPAAGPRPAGAQRIEWRGDDLDGRPVPSGAYFVLVEAAGRRWTLRAALIR